jgi:hypothetical protein
MGDGGGFQQIIIIGLFLLFGLADLIARWARGRTRSSPSGEPVRRPVDAEERPWQVDMPWQDDDHDVVVMERPVRVDAPAPERERVERAPPRRDRTARDRSARDRTSSVRQAVVRTAPVRPVASRVATGGISARDRMAAGLSVTRRRGLTFTADDARRGVIAMTVLGPCRALDDSARDR